MTLRELVERFPEAMDLHIAVMDAVGELEYVEDGNATVFIGEGEDPAGLPVDVLTFTLD